MKHINFLILLIAISMALAFTACSSSDDSVGGGGKDSPVDTGGGIKGKKLTELIVSGVQYQPYGDHYDNDGYGGDDDYGYYDYYRQDDSEYKFKIEYDSQNRLSKILLACPILEETKGSNFLIEANGKIGQPTFHVYYDATNEVYYYYYDDVDIRDEYPKYSVKKKWYSRKLTRPTFFDVEYGENNYHFEYDVVTDTYHCSNHDIFLYYLPQTETYLTCYRGEGYKYEWYSFDSMEDETPEKIDITELKIDLGTEMPNYVLNMVGDYEEILKVDYNSKVITIATRNWLYKKTDSWAYREHLPLSRQIRFDTNEKGYINKLSDYTIEYDNNGYLTGVKETNKMWTFAYNGNDLASAMSEDLTTLNSTLLYYLTYPDNANKGELNVYMDVPRRKGYLSKNTINEVALLIAYQCGLFGKTTSRYKVISDLKDKTINIDQKIQNKNKSLKLKYKLSCVFE